MSPRSRTNRNRGNPGGVSLWVWVLAMALPEHHWFEGSFDEKRLAELLGRAQRAAIVTDYDTGAGRFLWFEGPPCPGMRSVVARVEATLGRQLGG